MTSDLPQWGGVTPLV